MQDADTNPSSPGLDAPFIALFLKKDSTPLGKGKERDEHESPAGNYYSAEKPRLRA